MDTQDSNRWREIIAKEQKVSEDWKTNYAPELIKKEKKKVKQAEKTMKNKNNRRRSNSRELLYEGLSREGKGRAAYLRHQHEKPPQKRYSRPKTSNQEIGWYDDPSCITLPNYGHRNIVRNTFYRSTGVE
eukprot:gb/GECH01005366.1/.p1 GENE.gb/GECH01005366.1/~~gb/GECH01005366.1/.p1  ORF type:complete len:130 (+),score=30.03 gb/GECH01005366.1/:1-390(+)